MKRILMICAMLALAGAVNAQVDMLVSAKEYWQISKAIPVGTSKDSTKYFSKMKRQTQRGDILMIKPAGHIWGNMERPPHNFVIEVTDISMAQAAKFMEPLIDSALVDGSKMFQADTVDIKERRFHFSETFVDSALARFALDGTNLSMTAAQASVFILEYDKEEVKLEVRNRSK